MSARRDRRTGWPAQIGPNTVAVDYTNRTTAYAHLRKLESIAARNPHDDLIHDLVRSLRALLDACERGNGEQVH